MPIYEFFCPDCNMIFNFLSKRVDTTSRPACPRCNRPELERQVSIFSTIGKASEDEEKLDGLDDSKMEEALESLMRDSERINEDDPKQMASLMRRFTEKTGINLGENMEEAIARMEKGEDPEQIEKEMGDLFDDEDGFSFDAMKKRASRSGKPIHDEKLYEL